MSEQPVANLARSTKITRVGIEKGFQASVTAGTALKRQIWFRSHCEI